MPRHERCHAPRARAALVLLLVASSFVTCVVGEEEAPGCRRDEDCQRGVCRAGACFEQPGPQLPPADPGADAGDAGDASEGGAGGAAGSGGIGGRGGDGVAGGGGGGG